VDINLRTAELTGDWERGSKRREFWNPEGVLSSVIEYTWDAVTEQWAESSLMEFYIDAYGNDTLTVLSTKSGEDWVGTFAFRTECIYDGRGRLIQEISFNGPLGSELENRKFEYTLDESGNRISTLRYNYESDWVLFQRSESSFDHLDPEVEEITYTRSGEAWVELSKKVFAWDDNGKITVNEYQEWDEGSGKWILTMRDDITYDTYGNMVLKIAQSLLAPGEPMTITRTEYFFNPAGKRDTMVVSVLDNESGEYTPTQKQFTRHAGDYFIHYDTICNGEVYAWEGETIPAGGIYRKEYVSVLGLDSIYALGLQENPAPTTFLISGSTLVAQDQEAM